MAYFIGTVLVLRDLGCSWNDPCLVDTEYDDFLADTLHCEHGVYARIRRVLSDGGEMDRHIKPFGA